MVLREYSCIIRIRISPGQLPIKIINKKATFREEKNKKEGSPPTAVLRMK